jgi:hypothetical protein
LLPGHQQLNVYGTYFGCEEVFEQVMFAAESAVKVGEELVIVVTVFACLILTSHVVRVFDALNKNDYLQ